MDNTSGIHEHWVCETIVEIAVSRSLTDSLIRYLDRSLDEGNRPNFVSDVSPDYFP